MMLNESEVPKMNDFKQTFRRFTLVGSYLDKFPFENVDDEGDDIYIESEVHSLL